MTYLLDTNLVTYILKKNLLFTNKLEEVRRLGKKAFISCITYHEVKRGLVAVNATIHLSEFNQLCQRYKVLLLDDIEIIKRASEIHIDLKCKGNSLEDANILIAATAITRSLILVSHDSDMRIPGITLEDWLESESGVWNFKERS